LFRVQEKGGRRHEIPANRNAADYMDAYLAAAIADQQIAAQFLEDALAGVPKL
jgi:hypothetical protein